MPVERLQKIIAAAGVASRRKAEELITSGRVQVNGTTVTELGTKADSEQDHIRVDGKLLRGPERHTYIVLNKPKGYVTTVSDPEKRPTVMDLVGGAKARVYPVGRLDWASEGLLLLTNDGELANALMKASSNVPKIYVVKVAGQPDNAKLDKLREGVSIAEKGGRRVRTAPAKIRQIREADNPWFEVTIIEGRNRQVRKMFEEVGHHVEKIRRVQYGPLALDVPPGEFRSLTLEEVSHLKAAAAGKKTFAAPRSEVMPTVQPQSLKPSDVVVDRSVETVSPPPAEVPIRPRPEVSARPIAKLPFRPSSGIPRDSKPKMPFRPRRESSGGPNAKPSFRPRAGASREPRAKMPFRPRPEGAGDPNAKPPFRPRAGAPRDPRAKRPFRPIPEGSGSPDAKRPFRPSDGAPRDAGERGKVQYRARRTGQFQARSEGGFKPKGRPAFRPKGGAVQRPRDDSRGFGSDRRPDRGASIPADVRRPPRPPFGARKPFKKPGAATGSAEPGKKRPFERPKTGTGFSRPRPGRDQDRRPSSGATGRPSGSRPRGPRR